MRAKGSGGAEDANPHHATVTPTTRAVDSVWTYVVHVQERQRGSVRLELGYSMIMILFRARAQAVIPLDTQSYALHDT